MKNEALEVISLVRKLGYRSRDFRIKISAIHHFSFKEYDVFNIEISVGRLASIGFGEVVFESEYNIRKPGGELILVGIESFRPGLWVEKLRVQASKVEDYTNAKFSPIDDRGIFK